MRFTSVVVVVQVKDVTKAMGALFLDDNGELTRRSEEDECHSLRRLKVAVVICFRPDTLCIVAGEG